MTRSSEEPVPISSGSDIRKRLDEVRKLANDGHLEPALLMAWGTMEGVARSVASDRFSKPQTPGRIVETLAMDGFITPSEADLVRSLVPKRNKLIHGQLDVRVEKSEIESFAGTIERLFELSPA